MFRTHLIDFLVVLVYLAGVAWLGVRVGRLVKSRGDFFMPRRFGKGMMMMHAFGTGTASDQAVVVASGAFRSGLSGIWYQWLWLFNTPFYWLIAPIFRRLRAFTTADVYHLRFDRSVAVLFALVGIAGMAVKIGLMLKGAGALIESGSNGLLVAELAIPVVAVLFVAYGTAGGLGAAIVTDFIQGLLTIVFSLILLPSVLGAVGGLSGMRDSIQDPAMLSLLAPEGLDAFFVATFALLSLVGIVAQPFVMGICSAGRTEFDGRFGFVVGNLVKRLCTVAWALTGLGAFALYMQSGVDVASVNPDDIYGTMAYRFLPAMLPGLLGVFMAALLAGVMSSCDSYMITASGLFTENIYRPRRPGRTEAHYLLVGRVTGVAVVVCGVGAAYLMPNVVEGLKIWLKIAPMLGIAFWLGLFWRRFNAPGAWASTLAGFLAWWLVSRTGLSEPAQIVVYLGVAAAAGIAVSLATRPTDPAKLVLFHELIRTPVRHGEVVTEPCRLPEGTTPAERAVFFRGTDFEFPVPSRVSVIGFLLSCVAVVAMILAFVWLVR